MADIIFDLANIIPLGLAASFLLFSDNKGSLLASLPVIVSVVCVLLLYMKKRGRLVLSGTVISLAAGSFIVAGNEGRQAFMEGYAWTLYVILLSIAVFAFEEAAQKYRKLKIVSCLGLVCALLYMLFFRIQAGRVEVSMILFYLLLSAAEEIQLHWKKEGDQRLSSHITFILPFPVFVLIMLLFLKAPAKPYDWAFVKKAVKTVRTAYEIMIARLELKEGWDGGDAVVGFSDEGGIGSRIRGQSYPALSLETDRVYEGRIYLSGRTFDTFDGREWKKTDDSDTDGRTYDLLLTYAALHRYDPDHISDYIQHINTTIGYKGVRTRLLFAPLKSFPLTDDIEVTQIGEDLSFGKRKPSSYIMTGYRVNRSNEGFEKFLQGHDDPGRMDLFATEMKVLKKDDPGYSYEGLLEYEDHIREVYGRDPGLSEKMKEYLAEILDGTEGDAEKLSAIEDMLSGMKYDTNPGKIPDEVENSADFVDYMVFNKKAGYCVHYATAFVLLSRAMGIPARYVQGYSVKMKGREKEIMSSNAHAWPEVYINGTGWTVYEPTPGYRVVTGWKTSAENGQGAPAYGTDYAALYSKEVSFDEVSQTDEDVRKKTVDPRSLLIPLSLVLVFLLVFFIIDRIVRKYRYNTMDEREKILACAAGSLRRLKRFGIVLQQGETVAELKERAGSRIPEELLLQFEIYEKVLYAKESPGRKDVIDVENGSRELARFIHRQKVAKLLGKKVV